jgi:hypothetical protein
LRAYAHALGAFDQYWACCGDQAEWELLGRAVLTEARYWSIALVYLLAYVTAVHYRIMISDWLAAHLPI